MTMFKTIAATAFLATTVLAVTPASAVVSTFATFSAINSTANFRFLSSGNAAARLTDATIFSTAVSNGPAASVNVRFSFLEPAFTGANKVQNVVAKFTLNAAVAKNTPTAPIGAAAGTNFVQGRISGTFSFLTTSAITVSGPTFVTHTYAAGSNLLSGTFAGADITGKIGGTSGAAGASTLGGDTIVFTSDFLDFTNTVNRDLGLTLTSVLAGFNERTGVNKALNNFRANVSGQFSSDPAPLVNGLAVVPEPQMWVLMVAGFGMVGLQVRRRTRSNSVIA